MALSGHNDVSIDHIEEHEVIPTLVAYLHNLAYKGGSIKKQASLSPATLMGYLNAAIEWLRIVLGLEAKVHGPGGARNKMIQDIIDQSRTWQKPKAKREPYSLPMFEALRNQVKAARKKNGAVTLEKKAAVLDWMRFTAFTGSRVGEYAQSVGTTTTTSAVPELPFAEEWAGTPIAFIEDDFAFYTKDLQRLPMNKIMQNPTLARELHVRFRYDKSPRNFVIRKFRSTGHKILCPVAAAISIQCRATVLGVKKGQALGVAQIPKTKNKPARVVNLVSNDVIRIMRQACLDAYPSPTDYHHINVKNIDAHSGRVYAALLLSNAGISKNEIAFRLRWMPCSVDHYLRDCSEAVERLTQAAVLGSLVT